MSWALTGSHRPHVPSSRSLRSTGSASSCNFPNDSYRAQPAPEARSSKGARARRPSSSCLRPRAARRAVARRPAAVQVPRSSVVQAPLPTPAQAPQQTTSNGAAAWSTARTRRMPSSRRRAWSSAFAAGRCPLQSRLVSPYEAKCLPTTQCQLGEYFLSKKVLMNSEISFSVSF